MPWNVTLLTGSLTGVNLSSGSTFWNNTPHCHVVAAALLSRDLGKVQVGVNFLSLFQSLLFGFPLRFFQPLSNCFRSVCVILQRTYSLHAHRILCHNSLLFIEDFSVTYLVQCIFNVSSYFIVLQQTHDTVNKQASYVRSGAPTFCAPAYQLQHVTVFILL